MENQNVKFMSINEFKALIGNSSEPVNFVKNPNTSKIFVSIGSQAFKCQQDITNKMSIKVLVPLDETTGELDNDQACFVNVKESADNVLFTI